MLEFDLAHCRALKTLPWPSSGVEMVVPPTMLPSIDGWVVLLTLLFSFHRADFFGMLFLALSLKQYHPLVVDGSE